VLHIFSPAQKSTYQTKKNYALLLRSKLKITKFEHNYNPSINTATKLFNDLESRS